MSENTKPIMAEIATVSEGRDITRAWVSNMAMLSPQDKLLTQRGAGDYDFYRQVLDDWQVFATFQQRRMALLQSEWEVLPGGKRAIDQSAADYLKEQIDRIEWDRITGLMHFGVFYGFTVAECMYAHDGRYIVLDAIKVRDRLRFCYDGALRLRLKTRQAINPGELLPAKKFWHWQTGGDHQDDPYGLGLAHWCYWPVLFKRENIRFWLISLEKFASPTAVAWFPSSMSGDSAAARSEREKLLAALRAIQIDAGVILPEGVRAELLQGQRSGANDYAQLCEYMDQAIAKVTIGQVMTSQAVGGQYKAEVQQDVLNNIVASDAGLICESFNQSVVRWLIDWNFQGAALPKVWRRTEKDEDLSIRADRERKIFDIGYRPTLAQVTDTYGGEWEPVESAAPVSSPPSQGGVAQSAGVVPTEPQTAFAEATPPTDDPTPVTAYTEQLSQAAGPSWQRWLTEIKQRVDQAESLESLRDDLVALYAELDSAELANVMQIAFACAELSGRYEVTIGE